MAYVSSSNGVGVPSTWLVAYNDGGFGAVYPGTMPSGWPNSPNGWAFSIDDGTTWTRSNAYAVGSGGPVGWGPFHVIPPAPGQGLQTVDSAGNTAPLWAGDPTVAVSPDGTVVALANLALAKPGSSTDRVVVSLSYDGGRTFPQSFLVNDTGCYDGIQDQPTIAFDPARDVSSEQSPEFWIAFRHSGVGAGFFGACARGARIDPDARTLSWLRPADAIDGLNRQFAQDVGGLVVQARAGIVSVMYADTSFFGRGGISSCSGTSNGTVSWFINESTDNGDNWSNAEYIAGPATIQCFVSGVEVGLRSFAFAQDSSGMQYFAVPAGSDGGRSVDIWRRDRAAGPASPLLFDARIHNRGSNGIFFPTLAADSIGRIGLLWGSQINASAPQIEYRMTSRGLARGWDPIGVSLTPPGGLLPVVLLGQGEGSDGDYAGIAGRTSDVLVSASATREDFVGAWTDTSQLAATGTAATVMAAGLRVR